MKDPFESPLFLISQTKENLAEFDALCSPVFKGAASSNIVEIDPKSGNKTYKIKFTRQIPGKARHIAASAVSDLRHALDQAAVASVKTLTGVNPEKLYFPFAANPNDLAARLRSRFPDQIHPTFLSFETYPTGKGYTGGNDTLAALSQSSGPNKHQITCKVGGRIHKLNANSIRGEGRIISMSFPPVWDIDQNELVVGVAAPSGIIHYDLKIYFYVALADAGKLSGAPALHILSALTELVDRIVLAIRTDTLFIAERKF